MTKNEIDKILLKSKISEWIRCANEEVVYGEDLKLKIKWDQEKARIFSEKWIRFPDREGTWINDYKVYYENSLIRKTVLLTVDGARGVIPLPKLPNNTSVSELDMNIARIVDLSNKTDFYIKYAKLIVEK
jgi:hypothetical protein